MNLENKIESILFWKGEPMELARLASIFKVELADIQNALGSLRVSLANRGVVLIEEGNAVMLGTHPDMSNVIEELQKEELNKDLSKASLETLSIILYRNGATRGEVDYIRGVNSNFTLRALSVRGLIERIEDPEDKRKYIWKPTFELLQFMGISRIEDLPEYEKVNTNLSVAIALAETQESNTNAEQV